MHCSLVSIVIFLCVCKPYCNGWLDSSFWQHRERLLLLALYIGACCFIKIVCAFDCLGSRRSFFISLWPSLACFSLPSLFKSEERGTVNQSFFLDQLRYSSHLILFMFSFLIYILQSESNLDLRASKISISGIRAHLIFDYSYKFYFDEVRLGVW